MTATGSNGMPLTWRRTPPCWSVSKRRGCRGSACVTSKERRKEGEGEKALSGAARRGAARRDERGVREAGGFELTHGAFGCAGAGTSAAFTVRYQSTCRP